MIKAIGRKNALNIYSVSVTEADCFHAFFGELLCQKLPSIFILKKKSVIFIFKKITEFERVYNFLQNSLSSDDFKNNCHFCEISKTYINRAFICDPKSQCNTFLNSNLEKFCLEEKKVMFSCDESEKKLHFFQVCNHIKDCEDGSDEENCRELNVKIKYFLRLNANSNTKGYQVCKRNQLYNFQ